MLAPSESPFGKHIMSHVRLLLGKIGSHGILMTISQSKIKSIKITTRGYLSKRITSLSLFEYERFGLDTVCHLDTRYLLCLLKNAKSHIEANSANPKSINELSAYLSPRNRPRIELLWRGSRVASSLRILPVYAVLR